MNRCKCDKKTWAKTIMWRIIASGTTFTLVFLFGGTLKSAGSVTALDTGIKTVLYFMHEKAWKTQKVCFQEEERPSNVSSEIETIETIVT